MLSYLHSPLSFSSPWLHSEWKQEPLEGFTPSLRSCWIWAVFNVMSDKPKRTLRNLLIFSPWHTGSLISWGFSAPSLLQGKVEIFSTSSVKKTQESSELFNKILFQMFCLFLYLHSTLDDECSNLRQQKLDRQVRFIWSYLIISVVLCDLLYLYSAVHLRYGFLMTSMIINVPLVIIRICQIKSKNKDVTCILTCFCLSISCASVSQ